MAYELFEVGRFRKTRLRKMKCFKRDRSELLDYHCPSLGHHDLGGGRIERNKLLRSLAHPLIEGPEKQKSFPPRTG